jgi:hypothetical protein
MEVQGMKIPLNTLEPIASTKNLAELYFSKLIALKSRKIT